jgi:beta-N-acetylhexosaminidase
MPVGGVVLFGFNLPFEPADLGQYIAALQDSVARGATARGGRSRISSLGKSRSDLQGESRSDSPIPLIVAIDHEGGSVFRFKGEGINRIPPPSEVGAKGAGYASVLGHSAGAELRALGVNMALAPVVELLTDGNKGFLGSRSYGREASVVDAAAGAYIRGLQAEGVAAVAKHFPGNAGEDPHKVLPKLDIDMAVYERDYLPRFASAIRYRVSAVMLSHVVFAALDPERPASLSPAIVHGELRKCLGFRGLAITDDLGMKALSARSSIEDSAVAALAAGADLLMMTDMLAAARVRDAIVLAVKERRLPASRLDEAVRRVLELKRRFRMEGGLDPAQRAKGLADFPSIVREDSKRIRSYRLPASSNS